MAEIHDRSNAQEKRLAKDVGGQRSSRSGATWRRKGDVRTDAYLYEAKTTKAKSYTLTPDVLKKLRQEAAAEGRSGVLAVELGDGRRYMVMPEVVWFEALDG